MALLLSNNEQSQRVASISVPRSLEAATQKYLDLIASDQVLRRMVSDFSLSDNPQTPQLLLASENRVRIIDTTIGSGAIAFDAELTSTENTAPQLTIRIHPTACGDESIVQARRIFEADAGSTTEVKVLIEEGMLQSSDKKQLHLPAVSKPSIENLQLALAQRLARYVQPHANQEGVPDTSTSGYSLVRRDERGNQILELHTNGAEEVTFKVTCQQKGFLPFAKRFAVERIESNGGEVESALQHATLDWCNARPETVRDSIKLGLRKLNSRNSAVQLEGCKELSGLRDPRAARILLSKMRKGGALGVAAAKALRSHRDHKTTHTLLNLIDECAVGVEKCGTLLAKESERDRLLSVRDCAATALFGFTDESAVKKVQEMTTVDGLRGKDAYALLSMSNSSTALMTLITKASEMHPSKAAEYLNNWVENFGAGKVANEHVRDIIESGFLTEESTISLLVATQDRHDAEILGVRSRLLEQGAEVIPAGILGALCYQTIKEGDSENLAGTLRAMLDGDRLSSESTLACRLALLAETPTWDENLRAQVTSSFVKDHPLNTEVGYIYTSRRDNQTHEEKLLTRQFQLIRTLTKFFREIPSAASTIPDEIKELIFTCPDDRYRNCAGNRSYGGGFTWNDQAASNETFLSKDTIRRLQSFILTPSLNLTNPKLVAGVVKLAVECHVLQKEDSALHVQALELLKDSPSELIAQQALEYWGRASWAGPESRSSYDWQSVERAAMFKILGGYVELPNVRRELVKAVRYGYEEAATALNPTLTVAEETQFLPIALDGNQAAIQVLRGRGSPQVVAALNSIMEKREDAPIKTALEVAASISGEQGSKIIARALQARYSREVREHALTLLRVRTDEVSQKAIGEYEGSLLR